MNKYSIEILSDRPPQIFLGEMLAGGQVVAIKSDEPDFVSTAWLADKTGLSKSSITDKLKSIAQGSGKFVYPRLIALQMLQDRGKPKGRPRKN